MIDKVFKYLEGKKTYLACALGFALIGATQLGWIQISPEHLNDLTSALTLAAIAALRAAK